MWGYWLSGMRGGQAPNPGALPGAGADGGPGAGFLRQSTCSRAPRTPHPPCYASTPSPGPLAPASPYLSVRRDVMPTRRRSAQGYGSSRGAGREPAQHEQNTSHPQAAAPAAPRPCTRAARSSSPSGRHLRAGVVTMECDASAPPPALAADRWRGLGRSAIGRVRWRTRAAASARASSWPMNTAGQPT